MNQNNSDIIYTPFPYPDNFCFEDSSSYQDYIDAMRRRIAEGRVDLETLTPEEVQKRIEANTPKEYYPPNFQAASPKKGILLIHGMMDSPLTLSCLAGYFGEKGFLTRTLLLPGHGTRPGDLLNIHHYEDWLQACRFGIRTLRQEVDHLTVLGFSAGAIFSIYLCLTEPFIDSLIILAPAIKLKSSLSHIIPWVYPLRNHSAKLQWPKKCKENDYAKYCSFPINIVYQVTSLMRLVNSIKKTLPVPLYMVSTEDDETISHRHALRFFLKQPHPLNRCIIYTKKIKPLHDPRIEQRISIYPEENILDFAHTTLPVSPNHLHYGRNGDFSDFAHYEKYPCFLQQSPLFQGAISRENLKNHYIKRLHYNPDFDYLVKDMEAFLEKTLR